MSPVESAISPAPPSDIFPASCTPDSAASATLCPPDPPPATPSTPESRRPNLASPCVPLPFESETHTNSAHDSTRNFPVRPIAGTQSPASPANRARTPPSTRFLSPCIPFESSPVAPPLPPNPRLATNFPPALPAISAQFGYPAPPPIVPSNISRAPHLCSDPSSNPAPRKFSAAAPPSFAYSPPSTRAPAHTPPPSTPAPPGMLLRPLFSPLARKFSFWRNS